MSEALNDFNNEMLAKHNELRALHHSPNLKIDWMLAKSAQAYAEKLAETMEFVHSDPDGQYGENLGWSFNSEAEYVFSGVAATQKWYNEIDKYIFGLEDQDIDDIGHFTQVVWKKTTAAGFGRAKALDGSFYVVGRYTPPGNCDGQFTENVL